jgi:hypothetical protein
MHYVCQKLSKIIYLIKSLRDRVSQTVLINVYYLSIIYLIIYPSVQLIIHASSITKSQRK